jgi:TolB protein
VGGAPGYELRVVASDGSGDRPLFDGPVPGCAAPMRPGWSASEPDQLAVPCYPFQGAPRAELRIVRLDGTTVRVLPTGIARMDDVSFSPDGSRVVYWGRDDAQGDGGQLYSVPADGSGSPQQLTTTAGNADAVFSPDGRQIAFRREVPGGAQIWVMAADGSGERALTPPGAFDQDPSWSPDGSSIVFKSNRPGPLPGNQFWIMDRNGQGLRQLGHTVTAEADNAAAWGPR